MSARFSRRVLLVGALVCLGLSLVWFLVPGLSWGIYGTPWPLVPFKGIDDSLEMVANSVLFLGVMLLAQWAFLRPVRQGVLHDGEAVRPRWHAITAVALVATLLVTGLIATILEMPDWWKRVVGFDEGDGSFLPVWIAMGVLWLGWFVVFFVYFRQGDFLAKAERVVRALIRGSCLELLIAIPTHALVYRRGTDDCYCVRGSYTGIVFGLTALLWAFGPGLVLLAWREKQRREPVLRNLCPKCGAPLLAATSSGATCSQCGHVTSE